MVDKVSRLQTIRHTKLLKKDDKAASKASNDKAKASAHKPQSEATTSAQTLRKQFIMQQLIKQFGEHIVHEPKFQDLYKFFEKKLASSPELQTFIDKKMNLKK